MMDSKTVLSLLSLTVVESLNWEKYQKFQSPQIQFNAEHILGNWYNVARLPSCSWAGSSLFTNHVSQYSLQPGGGFAIQFTFRSANCVSMELALTPNGPSGSYIEKDPIGNPITGPSVYIATDYKTFSIKWGCSKTVEDMCQDPYLVVKSRTKKPRILTWRIIESILKYKFELSLGEMIRVIHDGKACIKFPKVRRRN